MFKVRLNFVFCVFCVSEHEGPVNEGIPVDIKQAKSWKTVCKFKEERLNRRQIFMPSCITMLDNLYARRTFACFSCLIFLFQSRSRNESLFPDVVSFFSQYNESLIWLYINVDFMRIIKDICEK